MRPRIRQVVITAVLALVVAICTPVFVHRRDFDVALSRWMKDQSTENTTVLKAEAREARKSRWIALKTQIEAGCVAFLLLKRGLVHGAACHALRNLQSTQNRSMSARAILQQLPSHYRIHFKMALKRPEDLTKVVGAMRASFTQEGILKARAVEDRLMQDTWGSPEYDRTTCSRSSRT